MKKKTWLIIAIAVVCLAVLGVTVWCVAGGVKSTMPQPEIDPKPQLEQVPSEPQDEIVPLDPETGAPVEDEAVSFDPQPEASAEDNMVVDPWGDVESEDPVGSNPIEEELTEEEEAEKAMTEEELATSDEGWTGIY